MMRLLLVLILLGGATLGAQPTPLKGSAELHELLDRLNTVGTVLMLGAHPDDEDTAVISYFARGRHLRTVYFSATRGEGGQNLIGTEQGDLLGVIRTHELLGARRIDGGEQAFASVVDFGYSKAPEEALAKWGQQRLLRDMVRVIREIRPDVIVSRFPPPPGGGGHGQHTAVGWTGPEAYEAAGDATRFPEAGPEPWQARRYFYNVPTFNPRMEAAAAGDQEHLRVETGKYDPVLGKSYAEIAGESRSMHRSQAMGTSQRKGSVPAFFKYVAGEKAGQDIFDGIDTSWSRIEDASAVAEYLQQARREYDPTRPEKILPYLLKAYSALADRREPEVTYKRKELSRAIELASGIWVQASAGHWAAVPGDEMDVMVSAMGRGVADWKWQSARLVGLLDEEIRTIPELVLNEEQRHPVRVTIPGQACYSQPAWLLEKLPATGDCKQGPSSLRVQFGFMTPQGVDIVLEKPVLYRWVDRSFGERSRPLVVVPAVDISFTQDNRIFTDSTVVDIPVRVRSNRAQAEARVALQAPPGWRVTPPIQELRFDRREQERTAVFQLVPPGTASGGQLTATAEVDGVSIEASMQTMEYEHIPATVVFARPVMRVERLEVKLLSRNIGYVMGSGDKVPEALRQLGAKVTLLGSEDLTAGELGQFDAIVTGIRALGMRADLLAARERVLEYVADGGTLVVQYNTLPFRRGGSNAGAPTLGPYALTPSRLRVTDELAKVRFELPSHALLQTPNVITEADFEGWVQERGLYFMSGWDEKYEAVLACNDPGEESLAGGLLVASHGKGTYVFTAYSWFRQLPAGVPGAYRIFANLISAGKTP